MWPFKDRSQRAFGNLHSEQKSVSACWPRSDDQGRQHDRKALPTALKRKRGISVKH